MEAVKQGSATIGLKSDTHAVLLALKRASSELSAHQKKIIPIDNHVGVSIAGLTADARLLSKFMRSECLSNRYAHDTPLPISRLVTLLGNSILFHKPLIVLRQACKCSLTTKVLLHTRKNIWSS